MPTRRAYQPHMEIPDASRGRRGQRCMDPAVPKALILNAGSSSLKWTVLDAASEEVLAQDAATWEGKELGRHQREVGEVLGRLSSVDAVGHRVVHGGTALRDSVVIDERVCQTIADLQSLAPLHNPAALAGIDAATRTFPGVPQVAAFDTAFHSTISDESANYPLPWDWTQRWGLRRFGFHGLSVQYAVRRSGELQGAVPRRLVVCHLGAGCSVTAVADGRSVDTSMGFSPLEGLMMGQRSGSVDPGLLLHLLGQRAVAVAELDEALNERSGLLGVSGVSADMRDIVAAADAGNERAMLAQSMFIHRLIGAVGSMVAILGGLDTLVFTGGIGEHSPRIRRAVADTFGYAGLRIDDVRNASPTGDVDVATDDSAVRVLVVMAREDLAVLGELRRLLYPTLVPDIVASDGSTRA
jgi:acetate kinase